MRTSDLLVKPLENEGVRRLNGMAVMVNDHTAFRVDWMPFGGHRGSGLGLGGIGYSMRDMTLERMVVFRCTGRRGAKRATAPKAEGTK